MQTKTEGAEREQTETADFGLGQFADTGLGGLVYLITYRCCAKELAIWPNQTCSEHKHPRVGDGPGKEETFRCRWGKVWLYVAGPKTPVVDCQTPHRCKATYTVWREVELNPGDQFTIPPNTLHYFQSGDEGAVVSEFSTRSTDENDIFTDAETQRLTRIA